MFTKLKKQVKEKSDDSGGGQTGTNEVRRSQQPYLNGGHSAKSSSVSDGNQSSDEISSVRSNSMLKQDEPAVETSVAIANETSEENCDNVNNKFRKSENSTTRNETKATNISTNKNQNDENSFKSQLQQFNQSLLNQIDVLAVRELILKFKFVKNIINKTLYCKTPLWVPWYKNE
jgi:hypothetical protein